MKKEIVAIQGELGAYSHLAAINFFKNPEIKTCTTFEEAFQTAFQNENYKIIIPIENSLAGRLQIFIIFSQNISYKYMLNIFKMLNIIYLLKRMLI